MRKDSPFRMAVGLVELYTGLIYEGPGLRAAIKDGLLALLRRDGHDSIAQVVGKPAR